MCFKYLMAHNIPLYDTVISKQKVTAKRIKIWTERGQYEGREKHVYLLLVGRVKRK